MGLTVVIVTYKHQDMVEQLLKSINIYNDIGNELEVIIVDNSPDSEVIEFIKHKNYRYKLILIKNINNGYGAANNIGARVASSKYLLFLNPDTILIESIFKYALDKFKECDMFGLRLIDERERKSYSYRYNFPYQFKSYIVNRISKFINIFSEKNMYILGADIFIKKDVFFAVGGFDENIFMYNEEYDLSNRLLQKNYKIKYFADKSIVHLEGSGEYAKHDYIQRKRYLESFKYVCLKYNLNYGKLIKRQYKFLIMQSIIYKLCFRDDSDIKDLIQLYKNELENR